jgi:hypothetical protein
MAISAAQFGLMWLAALTLRVRGDFGDSEGLVEGLKNEPLYFKADELPEGFGGKFDRDSGMWIPPHHIFGIQANLTTGNGFQASAGQSSYVGHIWRPNKDGQPEIFDLLYPELCEFDAVKPDSNNKIPGFNSKRVALVFRGDALRGFSYGTNVKGYSGDEEKRAFYCTDLAMAIGEATAKAQLKYMVEPLEKAGLAVDIYLTGYGCTGLQHISKEEADRRYKQMVGWYGKHVVAHSEFDRDSVNQYLQDLGTQQAMMLLMKVAKVRKLEYHSVLLWRYDMVPYVAMGPPKCGLDEPGCFKKAQEHDWFKYYWQNYALLANRQLMWFEDDWAFAFPGWFTNCAIGTFMHHCMAESTVCIRSMQLNFQGGWPNREWRNVRGNSYYYIYRENYSLYGKKICQVLHTEFGGPPCPKTGEEAWDLACKDVRSIGQFVRLDPNAVVCGTVEKREDCKPGVIKPCEGNDRDSAWNQEWSKQHEAYKRKQREKWKESPYW